VARDIFDQPSVANLQRAETVMLRLSQFAAVNPLALRPLLRHLAADGTLYTHSVNTAIYALAIAHRGGAAAGERVADAALAAFLHDVGLCEVPSTIRDKPAPLTADEWAALRAHPVRGAEMVTAASATNGRVATTIRMHHERLDGSGYPSSLERADIHWEPRVVAVAEVLDALTSDRPYRPARPPFDVLQMMIDGKAGPLDESLLRQLIVALALPAPSDDLATFTPAATSHPG